MTLFDPYKLRRTDIPVARIEAAKAGVEKLRSRLVHEIHTHVIPDWLARSLTSAFFQAHVRRALMLIDGGYEAYLSGRSLISFMCVRSIYETVACVFNFCDKLHSHLDDGNFEATGNFIHTRLFATRSKDLLETDRDENFDYTTTNILTQIDRFSKHVADFRKEYDYFSEMLHPNCLGTFLHFSEEEAIDEYRSVVKFPDETNTHDADKWLVNAAFLLALMDHAIDITEKRLSEHTFLFRK